MNRQLHPLHQVGMVSIGRGLSLHRLVGRYQDPRTKNSPTGCGKWIKSLSDMKVDYLEPTRICVTCFRKTGAAFYSPADRYVIVEFFEQVPFNV